MHLNYRRYAQPASSHIPVHYEWNQGDCSLFTVTRTPTTESSESQLGVLGVAAHAAAQLPLSLRETVAARSN